MKSSRTVNSVRNILWSIIQKIVLVIGPFIVRTFLIRKLGNEYAGLNGLFSSILTVLSLTELGFGSAMVFSMYKPIHDEDTSTISALLNLYRKVYLVFGGIVLSVGVILMPFLPYLINNGDYPSDINLYFLFAIYLSNSVASYFLFSHRSSLLIAYQREDIVNKTNIISLFFLYVFQILVIILFKNIYVYSLLILLSTLVCNFVIFLISKKLYPAIVCKGAVDSVFKKDIKKRVFGVFLHKLCSTSRTSCDAIFISIFLGLVVLSQYQNYFMIVSSLSGLISVVSNSITSSVGDSLLDENKDKALSNLYVFLFIYMLFSGTITVCMVSTYQCFVDVWVGNDNVLPNSIAILLSLYFYIQSMGDIAYVYRTAAGLWTRDRIRPVVETCLNVLLNLALVYFFGLHGIIIATIITLATINFFWGGKILFRDYFAKGFSKYIFQHAINFLVTFFASALSLTFVYFVKMDGAIGFVVYGLSSLFIALSIYFLCYFKTDIFKKTLLFLKNVFINLKSHKRLQKEGES